MFWTPGLTIAGSALVLAFMLSVFIFGLRLNDRALEVVGRRDPRPILLGFESGADRLSDAAFATDVVVTPDGSVFFAEYVTGRIGVLVPSADGFEEQTAANVELPELGRLLHLAIHPEWPAEPYLYFTAHEGVGAAQRLTIQRARIEDFEAVEITRLIGDLPTEDPTRGPEADHFGSALAICDGSLYVSIGDTDSPGPGDYREGRIRDRAQDVAYAEGKVLRYRLAGTELEPDGELGNDPPVFALGLRNTFAMDCDPESGWPIAADNGLAGLDQVRLLEPGTNHGWPDSNVRREPTPPLYSTGIAAVAPTGIVAREVDDELEVLFGSFHTSAIYRLNFDADRSLTGPVGLMHRASSSVLSMAEGADGCVYYTTSDAVWRVQERSCGAEPVASVPAGASVGQLAGPPEAGSPRFDGAAESVYQANCVACHGAARGGGAGPALLGDTLTEDDDFYLETILEGRPDLGMPSWGAAGMSDDQARRLLEFLRSPVP